MIFILKFKMDGFSFILKLFEFLEEVIFIIIL